MFKTAFYGCLRASELCNLDVEDIDLDKLALMVRDGKGGKTAVCYLFEDAAETLPRLFGIKPASNLKAKHLYFSRILEGGLIAKIFTAW